MSMPASMPPTTFVEATYAPVINYGNQGYSNSAEVTMIPQLSAPAQPHDLRVSTFLNLNGLCLPHIILPDMYLCR